ncbi:MAG: DUF547 domain-containing protein [Desulfuromonas sp.]|nr:DUF547 domain-containing protein [Desulfuromonas sp.]
MSYFNRCLRTTNLLLIFYFAMLLNAYAAPKADLLPRWLAHDPSSTIQVDHSLWSQFLTTYLVSGKQNSASLLRYAQVTLDDKAALKEYLQTISATPMSQLNRTEQKASWINIYNALTVNIILEHYPLDSIKDISSSWFSSGPWDIKLITIEGENLSLNDIEHRILRPIWQDNRVHYAINCASMGCPNLQPQPFSADNCEQLLNKAAKDFINSPRAVRFVGEKLVLSRIYAWFHTDFGTNDQQLLQHLQQYAAPNLAAKLEKYNGSIDYSYDWSLNAAN